MSSAAVRALLALWLMAGCAHAETCIASHYGGSDGFHGKRTASGQIMNRNAMTAAMRLPVPFGSVKTVTDLRTGRRVIVTINDRGPFVRGRCIDLSYGAARALGMGGTDPVTVE